MSKKPRVSSAEGESEFLASYDPTRFERFSVAVDVVLVAALEGDLSTLLVVRDEHPYKGLHALPGGFLKKDETLEEAATRVLRSKANIAGVYLEQLYTFGEPRRDPRTRVISVVYYALVDEARFRAAATGERPVHSARIRVPWEGETGGPVKVVDEKGRALALAFDHADIVGMAVKRLRGKLDYAPVGFQLLGETFTLLALQRVHETVLGRPVNKDSFRRRMLASGQLEATGRSQSGVDHRPAELYRFARRSAV
ncbi:MAG: NUDIX domain-containing protein [Deltaproteobacteria bacterium]|nr:NUDIX domain-containing protein [Myxococcales bacterium]MDP3219826.1 NUDIX domain-containing protein [Deltaproteobacteria bacterium]